MDEVKDDKYYMSKAMSEIELIIDYSDGNTLYELQNSPAVLDGIIFRLIQLSEQISKISELFKSLHPEIRWQSIKGFRNRLVHDYGEVDLEFVYNAITVDVPKLKQDLNKYLEA